MRYPTNSERRGALLINRECIDGLYVVKTGYTHKGLEVSLSGNGSQACEVNTHPPVNLIPMVDRRAVTSENSRGLSPLLRLEPSIIAAIKSEVISLIVAHGGIPKFKQAVKDVAINRGVPQHSSVEIDQVESWPGHVSAAIGTLSTASSKLSIHWINEIRAGLGLPAWSASTRQTLPLFPRLDLVEPLRALRQGTVEPLDFGPVRAHVPTPHCVY